MNEDNVIQNAVKSGLPKVDLPVFEHHLKGINKKIKFRLFTAKEQKIVLLAKESEDLKEQVVAIKQIINLCTFGAVDAGKLPYFDLEDLFLQTRIRSVSNVATVTYEVTDEDKEGKKVPFDVEIDLNDATVVSGEDHNKKVAFAGDIGVIMRYPTLDEMITNEDEQEMVENCIEYVYEGEELYKFSDFSKEERSEWFDSLGMIELGKIKTFFDTMPKLKLEKKAVLPNGKEHTFVFEGISSFFA